jgi:antitoxin component of RelBE/YafQ-DinJ toxin-antitoxin module
MIIEKNSYTINGNTKYAKVADDWLSKKGYSISSIVNSFIKTIATEKRIPYNMPEEDMYPAYYKDLEKIHEEFMADLKAGRLKSYNSVEEMNADLRAEGYI